MTTKKELKNEVDKLHERIHYLEDTVSVLYHAQMYGMDGVRIITNMWDSHSFKVSYIKTAHDMTGEYKKIAISSSCDIGPDLSIYLLGDKLDTKVLKANDTKIIFSLGYRNHVEKFVVLKDIEILIPYKEIEGD